MLQIAYLAAGAPVGLLCVAMLGLWRWTTFTEKFIAAMFGVAVTVYFLYGLGPALILLGSIAIFAWISADDTGRPDPPTDAVPAVWNRREFVIVRERISFAFPFFPFLQTMNPVVMTSQNFELSLEGIRTQAEEDPEATKDPTPAAAVPPAGMKKKPKSGGAVSAKIALTFEPDNSSPTRLHEYINSGKEAGVKDILADIASEAMRREGANYTWEELVFLKEEVSVELIEAVTGQQPTKIVVRDARGDPIREWTDAKKHKYRVRPRQDTDIALTQEDFEVFLDDILANGPSDVRKLGIRLRRMNVIEILPEGKLKDDAEALAREQQQRRGEIRDAETENELAALYKKKNPDLTQEKALELARLVRNRSSREIIVRGNPTVAAFAGLMDGTSGGEQGSST